MKRVAGQPRRDYLWILDRKPTMSELTCQSIIARLQARGCETSRLVLTLQVAGPRSRASADRAAERI